MITIITMPRTAAVLLSCLVLSGCVTKLVDRMTGEDKADEIRATGQRRERASSRSGAPASSSTATLSSACA
jgi:hypothetical protein